MNERHAYLLVIVYLRHLIYKIPVAKSTHTYNNDNNNKKHENNKRKMV